MTCIVGLVDAEDKIWMGGDSATVSTEYGLTHESFYRKVAHNGDFLIGTAGSARIGQILKNIFEPPPCDGDVRQYMARDFVRAMRECIEKEDAKEQYKESEILIGYKGRLFYIGCNYMVSEPQGGYFAIGCGQEVALGVLYTVRRLLDCNPEDTVKLALCASEKFNAYVRHPFYLETI